MSTMYDRIAALHDQHMMRRSCLSIRRGAGVIGLVLSGKGFRTALEIGTYRGVGAAEISQYVDQVITIDLRYGRRQQLGEKMDPRDLWRELGITNIEFVEVEDNSEKWGRMANMAFDFAFLDGAKDPSIAEDFARVKHCGHVLIHDNERRGKPELDHVVDFIDSLPPSQVKKMDLFAYWTAK